MYVRACFLSVCMCVYSICLCVCVYVMVSFEADTLIGTLEEKLDYWLSAIELLNFLKINYSLFFLWGRGGGGGGGGQGLQISPFMYI